MEYYKYSRRPTENQKTIARCNGLILLLGSIPMGFLAVGKARNLGEGLLGVGGAACLFCVGLWNIVRGNRGLWWKERPARTATDVKTAAVGKPAPWDELA